MTKQAPRTGLIRLSREDYDAITDRANYSTIKHLHRSPAHYRHAVTTREDRDTAAMQIGRITHLAIFEPERFDREIAIWDGGQRRGKAWDAFREEHEGKELVRRQDVDSVLRLAESIRSHPDVAAHLAQGEPEVTALWTDPATGVECKARLDWIAATGVILDLKTTRDAFSDSFERDAYRLQYHVQAAFYSDAVRALTGADMPFVIIAAENTAPYVVQPYILTEEALDAGRRLYRQWLHTLVACRKTDNWPGYSSEPLPLCLPKWAEREGEPFTYDEEIAQ